MDAYIVIGVMILMIVAFVMNKWPFGLITMSCCIILGVTGVLDASGTFAGFCNPFVVMLAGSFVVTNALAKQVLFQMSRKGSYSSKMENPDFA